MANSKKIHQLVLDDIHLRILQALQEDSRLTIAELAEKVGLSASPCHRRVRSWKNAASSIAMSRC